MNNYYLIPTTMVYPVFFCATLLFDEHKYSCELVNIFLIPAALLVYRVPVIELPSVLLYMALVFLLCFTQFVTLHGQLIGLKCEA